MNHPYRVKYTRRCAGRVFTNDVGSPTRFCRFLLLRELRKQGILRLDIELIDV